MKRILIIRPSALGDVCRTVPVLVSLRRAWPGATIDWVVRDSFAEAIAGHPALDNVIEFPRRHFSQWWRNFAVAEDLLEWIARLREQRYDLVVDCQGLGRSGLIALLSGARLRVGPADAREFAWLGYNTRVSLPQQCHTVDAMLGLLQPLGVPAVPDMRLYPPPEAQHRWENRLSTLAGSSETTEAPHPYAVLAPTSRWMSKRWPLEQWTELIKPLLDRGFHRIVLIGAPYERAQLDGLFAAIEQLPWKDRVIDMVGNTTIGETMAIIEGAALLVANDSAPLHIAVGVNTPLVGLFGPTDPKLVGPYGCDDAVVRSPQASTSDVHYRDRRISNGLMRLITVEQVLERVDEVCAARQERAGRIGPSIASSRAVSGSAAG